MFLNSNLVTPENFIQFRPSFQKLLMIFFNTDGQTQRQMDRHKDRWTDTKIDGQTQRQMDRHTDRWTDTQTYGQTHRRTDTQTPYKINHPTTLFGYRQKIFYPIFSTSLKTECFVWIKITCSSCSGKFSLMTLSRYQSNLKMPSF